MDCNSVMAIDDDVKWLVQISFIGLTFLLAFGWRLNLKLGKSDEAIAVNYGRYSAQRMGLRQKSWIAKDKKVHLIEADLIRLEENAENARKAATIIKEGGPFVCPWGKNCPFVNVEELDLAPLEYLTGKYSKPQALVGATSISGTLVSQKVHHGIHAPTKATGAWTEIQNHEYGDYERIKNDDEHAILNYLLGIHAEAASLYTERRILETARKRTEKVIEPGVDKFTVGGTVVTGHELRPDEVRLLVF
jgi:hypothetical protein